MTALGFFPVAQTDLATLVASPNVRAPTVLPQITRSQANEAPLAFPGHGGFVNPQSSEGSGTTRCSEPDVRKGGWVPRLTTVSALVDRGRASVRPTLTSPHKCACDDGAVYVVKPNTHDRQFANELLAFGFAALLDVPVFDAALVHLTSKFLSSSPTLAMRYSSGIHFGTQFPNSDCFDGYNAAPGLIMNEVYNASQFYRLAIFDEVIHNGDRGGNPGNVVFVRSHPPPREFEFRAIDHGNAFTGPAWSKAQLDAHVPTPLVPVLTAARDLFVSRSELLRNATAVTSIAVRFSDAVEQANSGLNDEERAAIIGFTRRRAAELSNWVAGPVYAAQLPSLA